VKLLIAVGQAVSTPEELPPGVLALVQDASEVVVMSPSVVSGVEWLTGGVDRSRKRADERLSVVLDQLEDLGIPASGVLGDELIPVAFDDALREFEADHVLIVLASSESNRWRRRHVLDRLLEKLARPITVMVVGPDA
jgi:hypothetical protein